MVDNVAKLRAQLAQEDSRPNRNGNKHRKNRLIQRYIENPLLIAKRKFDIRAYSLIASTSPDICLGYKEFYVRRTVDDYCPDKTDNLAAHLTNQAIQKKHEDYQAQKDDTTCM